MGAEQSNNNPKPSQMSRAEVNRLLRIQQQEYERKCQEMLARATAQNSPQPQTCTEKNSTPYSFSANELQQRNQTLYPNLNEAAAAPRSPAYVQSHHQTNNNYRASPQEFVFVENNQRFRPAPSAPSAPIAPRGGARSRSVSRQRNTTERDVFDCPTCGKRFGVKIWQCDSGHSSCDECKFSGRPCGLCGLRLTDRRNYDVENHVAQTKTSCLNASDGCKLFIKTGDMENHLKECPFKEQQCPITAVFGTCRWKGKLNQISSHFNRMHQNGPQANVDTEMRITNIRNNSQELHLIVLGAYNFLFNAKVSEVDGVIYMAVQLIGTKMSAEKWVYEVHVYNKSANRRKYVYTDFCRSSSVPVQDIFKEKDCAVLPVSHATTFFNEGALTYKIFIKKSNEGKNDFPRNQRGRGRGRGKMY